MKRHIMVVAALSIALGSLGIVATLMLHVRDPVGEHAHTIGIRD